MCRVKLHFKIIMGQHLSSSRLPSDDRLPAQKLEAVLESEPVPQNLSFFAILLAWQLKLEQDMELRVGSNAKAWHDTSIIWRPVDSVWESKGGTPTLSSAYIIFCRCSDLSSDFWATKVLGWIQGIFLSKWTAFKRSFPYPAFHSSQFEGTWSSLV